MRSSREDECFTSWDLIEKRINLFNTIQGGYRVRGDTKLQTPEAHYINDSRQLCRHRYSQISIHGSDRSGRFPASRRHRLVACLAPSDPTFADTHSACHVSLSYNPYSQR